jgi:tetratricopeptide (TPR) repeat protein
MEDTRQIAEYYFSKDFYGEALELFQTIQKENEIANDLCQKTGFCYQKLGDFSKALQQYLQAEFIAPNEKWTLRKIAYCYRKINDYNNALAYYLKLNEITPDSPGVLTQIGNCYLNNKQYDDALAYFFKVEYSDPENSKIWRAIAWSSFLAGKNEQAKKYLLKAIAEKEEWTDYLNLGHIALTEGHKKDAVENYEKAFLLSDKNFDTFIINFTRDAIFLVEKGVDNDDIHILLDYLRYLMD